MDSFQSTEKIIVQPGTSAVPYTFTFAACSSATANDGSLPFDTTISSAAVKAFSTAGTDVTAELIDSSSSSSTVVTVALNYPTSYGAGRYSIEMLLTLSTGAVIEADFTRIFVKDIAA